MLANLLKHLTSLRLSEKFIYLFFIFLYLLEIAYTISIHG